VIRDSRASRLSLRSETPKRRGVAAKRHRDKPQRRAAREFPPGERNWKFQDSGAQLEN